MDKADVSALLDEIYAMAHLLGLLLEEVENSGIKVNPHAVASIAKMISSHIMKICRHFQEIHPP